MEFQERTDCDSTKLSMLHRVLVMQSGLEIEY